MVSPAPQPDRDGSVVLLMFGIAVLGVAAFIGVVEPASRELRATELNEERLKADIQSAERERARLEMWKKGLVDDPEIIERQERAQGRGGKDEVRYVRPDSAPVATDKKPR